jgi:hypothetical protein
MNMNYKFELEYTTFISYLCKLAFQNVIKRFAVR